MKHSDQPKTLLDVRRLTKHFSGGGLLRPRRVYALNEASFTLNQQEVVALVGESGSGKSTVARLLARLIPPTAGEIFFNGQDVLRTEPRRASLSYRRQVQMIFQDPFGSLNPVHTIGHHLERPLRIHHIVDSRQIREQVFELLSAVGLNPPNDFANRYPYELSGGQRQRVAIARALAVNPRIILADEPISMLDVSIRMGVLNLMAQLKEERKISFLYITHDLASARYIGDRIIVMYAGHIVEDAESTELLHAPAHPYTQLLLSAVPNPHAGLATRTVQPRREVHTLLNPPTGCPFAARCPKVMEICRQVRPPRTMIDNGHWVHCHLYPQQESKVSSLWDS